MNDKQNKQRITVTIANRSYSLNIEREKLQDQEPFARSAAGWVNARIDQYAKRFGHIESNDLQDNLSKAAWEIAYDYLKLRSTNDAGLLAEELEKLDATLERYLRQTENADPSMG
ncbi:MAG: cell division protein ZapA [Porphyromonadaceae bacterium]|nr:cell division protein ZapA [Porphyromonadaceae bacterium]